MPYYFLLFLAVLLLNCSSGRKAASESEAGRPMKDGGGKETAASRFGTKVILTEDSRKEASGGQARYAKQFYGSSPLDSLLDTDPVEVDTIITAEASSARTAEKKMTGSAKQKTSKVHYRIQLLTVADFEIAQNKKYALSKILGPSIDILFDPPFYKLRYGWYSSKKKAQDRLRDIQDLGLQGFVVRQ